MKTRLIVTATAIMSVLFITNTSCNKHTDVKATIVCKDSLDRPMVGANVKLYATVTNTNHAKFVADVKAEGTSDSNGEISFIFKLPAIFDVKVTKNGFIGTGIVKVDEPGKEAEKTIIVR